MAYLGTLSVLLALWGGWLLWRKKLEGAKWFQRAALAGIAFPFLSNFAGWILTEAGRQPWVAYGLLKTEDAVSGSVSAWTVGLSLGLFVSLYTVLGLVDLYLMRRYARLDPPEVGGEGEEGRRNRRRPIEMTLETLWFCLLCVLWTGYFITEGFDFGVGMLLPVLGRSEEDRRTMFESIGPVWDGNEVWLVIAGGATFAAFPVWYATMFSGFYLALLLDPRSAHRSRPLVRVAEQGSQPSVEIALVLAQHSRLGRRSTLWGIALASLLNGVPIASDQTFAGSFGDLFSAYTILAGIAVCLLFALHGAVFLTLRTLGDLRERARRAAARLAPVTALVGAGFLVWTLVVANDRNDKGVFPGILPVAVAAVAAVAAIFLARRASEKWAFGATALTIVAVVVTLFVSLYPRVMVSDPDFGNSLTVDNASSADYTLTVMTVVAAVLIPIILLYQAWTYHVFRARLGGEDAGSPVDLLARKTGS